jgi:NAD+ kinase
MHPFRTAAIIGKFARREDTGQLSELARFLSARGLSVLVERHTHECLADDTLEPADFKRIGREADLAVVVGGDGTLLTVARELAAHGVPLVGINRGRLGFTTDIAMGSMLPALERILDGKFMAEERTLLEAKVDRKGQTLAHSLAFNDVVASRGVQGGMIEFRVMVDDEFAYELRADGLIVATPTGSTAYALSSGGPIVHPSVAGLILVPVSPHTLSNRPIVVGDGSRVEVALLRSTRGSVYFDGRDHHTLQAGDRLTVTTAPARARLLHPEGYSYFQTLREKLGWSGAPQPGA